MKSRLLGYCVSLIALGFLATGLCSAASIPAWLDDAISKWNHENQAIQIQFVDIKDSYVWYAIPGTSEIGHAEIRESIYRIVQERGYQMTADEELITTGRPPSPNPPQRDKKCWTRSFVRDIEELSNTKAAGASGYGAATGMRQRMLTSLVCDNAPDWSVGIRILQ